MKLINCEQCEEEIRVRDGFLDPRQRRNSYLGTDGALCPSCGWIAYGYLKDGYFVIQQETISVPGRGRITRQVTGVEP